MACHVNHCDPSTPASQGCTECHAQVQQPNKAAMRSEVADTLVWDAFCKPCMTCCNLCRHGRGWFGACGDIWTYCQSAHYRPCSKCHDSTGGGHSEATREVPSHCCGAAAQLKSHQCIARETARRSGPVTHCKTSSSTSLYG